MPPTEAQIKAACAALREFVRDNTPNDPDDPTRRAFIMVEDRVLDWIHARAVMAAQARASDPYRKCLAAADRLARTKDPAKREARLAKLKERIAEAKAAERVE